MIAYRYRMNKLWILVSLLTLVSACVNESSLDYPLLDTPRTDHQVSLSEAVYFTPPLAWRKARSYIGYQAPGLEGSIELKEDRRAVAEIAKDFDKTILSRKGMKLKAFRPLSGTAREGFFVRLIDRRSNVEREQLVFRGMHSTIIVKGFFREAASGATAHEMHEALMSIRYDTTAIAELEPEPYVLAAFVKLEPLEIWRTKNGEFPPTTPDSLKIHSKTYESGGLIEGMVVIRQALKEATGEEGNQIKHELIMNGELMTSRSNKGGVFAGALLLKDREKGGVVHTVSANNEASVEAALYWIKDNSLRVVAK